MFRCHVLALTMKSDKHVLLYFVLCKRCTKWAKQLKISRNWVEIVIDNDNVDDLFLVL